MSDEKVRNYINYLVSIGNLEPLRIVSINPEHYDKPSNNICVTYKELVDDEKEKAKHIQTPSGAIIMQAGVTFSKSYMITISKSEINKYDRKLKLKNLLKE